MITEEDPEALTVPPKEEFLVSERVSIGGQYYFKAVADWRKAMGDNLVYAGFVQLYLDARPFEAFRFFGKVEAEYPFLLGEDALRVRELYADFSIAPGVYGRVGKQTIAWGVGRYFSPADVLNLTPIDIDDPDAERVGPVALKVHVSGFLSNFYVYVIANDVQSVSEVAFAPKFETVLGSAEIGLAGFYRFGMAPRLIAMATFPLGQVDWYFELVASWGSDRTFADDSGGTYGVDDAVVFQATAGFNYKYVDPLGDFTFNASGQFWFNGDGYEDPSLAILAKNDPRIVSKTILPGDLEHPDRFYTALNVSLVDILGSGISVGSSWFGGLGGSTGRVAPWISYAFNEDFSVTGRVPVSYGAVGAEFSPFGFQYAPTLEAKLFGNSTVSLSMPIVPASSSPTPFVLTLTLVKERF
ncbi:MAG: hypothetical protein AB1407_00675 [Spirochaetota bacterium]